MSDGKPHEPVHGNVPGHGDTQLDKDGPVGSQTTAANPNVKRLPLKLLFKLQQRGIIPPDQSCSSSNIVRSSQTTSQWLGRGRSAMINYWPAPSQGSTRPTVPGSSQSFSAVSSANSVKSATLPLQPSTNPAAKQPRTPPATHSCRIYPASDRDAGDMAHATRNECPTTGRDSSGEFREKAPSAFTAPCGRGVGPVRGGQQFSKRRRMQSGDAAEMDPMDPSSYSDAPRLFVVDEAQLISFLFVD
eukprot:GHVQ01029199.1.p1 GENE.GHVQ01029199.1~~GHVQ01029199.1.p1  ORF type:complete len:245 (-),score=37.19 GHVQ01029199.1:1133-1867(-)